MADDGLLVNFDVAGTLKARGNLTGGRWKDRTRIKKRDARLHHFRQNLKSGPEKASDAIPSASAPVDIEEPTDRPTKKRRLDEEKLLPSKGYRSDALPPRDFVSSLFTSNPKSTHAAIAPQKDSDANPEPSNAPLSHDANSFSGLGLHASLASHITEKLGLRAPTAIQKSAIPALINGDADAFLQAETGSGKTLAYLLPLVHRLLTVPRGGKDQLHRDSGLFAIILAPTRELCKQILVVLERLLGCAHWLVPGAVLGGERKKSEKARLRKGLNILVATPGRLSDHLSNTKVLDVCRVRWLVMDEGDRLMELGFEEEVRGILSHLQQHSSSEPLAGLPARRVTVLCSATMRTDVQRLGDSSLQDAVRLRAEQKPDGTTPATALSELGTPADFTAPAQLKQSHCIVPAKQRLVTLAALLRSTFARKGSCHKAIVFLSCADTVDFHFDVFSRYEAETQRDQRTTMIPTTQESHKEEPNSAKSAPKRSKTPLVETHHTRATAPLLTSRPGATLHIYRLHGSLAQPIRTSTLAAYTRDDQPSILLCTDVASRGLDLPAIDLVIEYDPAFSRDDHLHRIGRTARAGRLGKAMLFLLPGPEETYLDMLQSPSRSEPSQAESSEKSQIHTNASVASTTRDKPSPPIRLTASTADDLLRKGFSPSIASLTDGGPKSASLSTVKSNTANVFADKNKRVDRRAWEDAATTWQLDSERWVLDDATRLGKARRAFVSHVRAYATHVVAERSAFDVKELHLGHLAKAFALRERPASMGQAATTKTRRSRNGGDTSITRKDNASSGQDGTLQHSQSDERAADSGLRHGKAIRESNSSTRIDREHTRQDKNPSKVPPVEDAAAKMRRAVRMRVSAADEFNIG